MSEIYCAVLDRLTEPPYHKTITMAYDPAKDQLTELPGVLKNIRGIAYDNSGNLYVAEAETNQVFRFNQKENKTYIGPGKNILPSLDKTQIALISSLEKGKTVMLHDVTRKETKEVFRGDVRNISWGEGNTLQLVVSENLTGKILLIAREDFITVEALFPSALSPDNRKFLTDTISYSVDLVSIDYIEKPSETKLFPEVQLCPPTGL